MIKAGIARYDSQTNSLIVVRPNENVERKIRCVNLKPKAVKIFGVHVEGDEIWVLTGPRKSSRPKRKYIYKFSLLSGGSSQSL